MIKKFFQKKLAKQFKSVTNFQVELSIYFSNWYVTGPLQWVVEHAIETEVSIFKLTVIISCQHLRIIFEDEYVKDQQNEKNVHNFQEKSSNKQILLGVAVSKINCITKS